MKSNIYFICAILGIFLIGAFTPIEGVLEKLPPVVNTDQYDEINAVEDPRTGELYFTRVGYPNFQKTLMEGGKDVSKNLTDREYKDYLSKIYTSLGGAETKKTHQSDFNQDIWKVNSDYFSTPEAHHLPYPANSALPNSIVGYIENPFRWIVINRFYEEGGMRPGLSSVKVQADGSFEFPEPMHIYGFHTQSQDLTAAVKNDGQVIILSLDRPDALGQTDLFVCFKIKDNVWGAPKPLGDHINTYYKETSPFIGPDGKTLYFASDRPGGIGGLDIYVSKRKDYSWKNWSKPQRLGRPLNSNADDLQPSLSRDFRYLYITSRRDGSADIFRYDLLEDKELKPSRIKIRGKVVNLATGENINAEVYYGPKDDISETRHFHTTGGQFSMNVPLDEQLYIFPEKEGFESRTYVYNPNAQSTIETKDVTLYLLPKDKFTVRMVRGEKRIQLERVYFERSKAVMKGASKTELEKLLYVMQKNPNLNIRIEGHTDNRGPIDKLMKLSRDRAKAVKEHLVSKGVEAHRIQTKGFGPARPITDNSTEEKRQENRRVEFVILSQ